MGNEKCMYRIIAQKNGDTIITETTRDVSFEEAKNAAVTDVLGGIDQLAHYQNFVVLPLTTQTRWESRSINFCPRCGSNLMKYNLSQSATFDCHVCHSTSDVYIHSKNRSFCFL